MEKDKEITEIEQEEDFPLGEMIAEIFEGLTPEQKEEFERKTYNLIKSLEGMPPREEVEALTGLTWEQLKAMPPAEAMALVKAANKKEQIEVFIQTNKHYRGISKLSNELANNFINNGDIELAVAKIGTPDEVCTMNSLTYEDEDENIKITGRREFTLEDRLVHDAVCSLWVKGNRVITPAQVYRNMNGLSPTEPVNKLEIDKVDESMDKSRFTRLRVDYTEQAKLYGLDVDSAIIDSNLLSADVIIKKSGGYEVKSYKIKDKPPLYAYNEITGQLISIPTKLLNISKLDNTKETNVIKMYLLQRIEVMKSGHSKTNKIKYETMFEELNIKASATKKKRIREKIEIMLKDWKDQKHIINSKEYKIVGRKFEGIELQYKQDSIKK
jgi:hypothetical protein